MTYYEFQKKYLSLIEELNPNNENLTDDPDIAAKQRECTNQVMYEMARYKKIPKYAEIPVKNGDVLTFDDFEKASGYAVYQVAMVGGVKNTAKADGTVYKIHEDGTAEVELYVYPERITENTKAKGYEFDLSPDVLEVMVYGVAADLLKSDVSTEYGTVYANRYETLLQRLDSRYNTASITVEGGVNV